MYMYKTCVLTPPFLSIIWKKIFTSYYGNEEKGNVGKNIIDKKVTKNNENITNDTVDNDDNEVDDDDNNDNNDPIQPLWLSTRLNEILNIRNGN